MSLAAMANVSLVVALFFLIFAILGVQLFSGKFWACTDASVPDHAACVGNFTSPATGRVSGRRGGDSAAMRVQVCMRVCQCAAAGMHRVITWRMPPPRQPGGGAPLGER